MKYPTLQEVKKLAKHYNMVPLADELFSDILTPIQILKFLQETGKPFFIFESVETGAAWGRYSFLGYNPSRVIEGRGGRVFVDGKPAAGAPEAALKKYISAYKSPAFDYLPPFTGGFAGYFSYDYIQYAEPSLKLRAHDDMGFDDFRLMLFDKIIAFDHLRQKIIIIANVNVENADENYPAALRAIGEIKNLILNSSPALAPVENGAPPVFKAAFTGEEYCAMVRKAKHYIKEGDIFQAVISNRLTADYGRSLLGFYRKLRTINPSPYMFYINSGGEEIAGASPETLVSVQNGVVSTYPLAGTCRRGETPEEDKALVEALLQNEKELAEHDMLVDLGRNDLGKICAFGTVRVEEYKTVKQFSHVSHISSKITGKIKDNVDALDVVSAVLPAGTLSGAPKKRACEIIDELEGVKRGPYGGAVGYIDFAGNLDFCIGIRMAVLKDKKICVQSGAGIVYDSVPESEYKECINKAKAMTEAFK